MADRYSVPLRTGDWKIPSGFDTTFTWHYDEAHERMLGLYQKGKDKQWDANARLDWSIDVDPTLPMQPDETIAIYDSPVWEKMTERERGEYRHHQNAWLNSQFLHGEQGALICTAKLVQSVPGIDQKFYGATQVMDEARHVEIYDRYLRDKIELRYSINPNLRTLLEDVIADSRWDLTFLGMQIMIEGLALAAFAMQRDYSSEPLARELNAYVMGDEARHVAFGRLALRELYPQLTDAERLERQEFVVEASRLLYERFTSDQVWEALGLPIDECREAQDRSAVMKTFRTALFSRIVPTIEDIGLWGPTVERCFADLGVLGYRGGAFDDMLRADEEIADSFASRRGEIDSTIDAGRDA